MAHRYTDRDGTYILLGEGEHYWQVWVDLPTPVTRSWGESTGYTVGVVAKTAGGAKRAAIAEVRRRDGVTGTPAETRQDDGYLCAHCGRLGGH